MKVNPSTCTRAAFLAVLLLAAATQQRCATTAFVVAPPPRTASLSSSSIEMSVVTTTAVNLDYDAVVTSLDMNDPKVLLAGAIVVGVAVAASMANNEDDSEFSFGFVSSNKSDVSIPYDAAARLSYQAWLDEHPDSGRSNEQAYQEYKKLYEKLAVTTATMKKLQRDMEAFENVAPPKQSMAAKKKAEAPPQAPPLKPKPPTPPAAVVAKPAPTPDKQEEEEEEVVEKVDLSIPYDAAARLAYVNAGSKGDYDNFKRKYEATAVADVIKKNKKTGTPKPKSKVLKQPSPPKTPPPAEVSGENKVVVMDLSIPYDAAARLAYEKAGSKGDYTKFKTEYEADAVADVIRKNPPPPKPDLSIPYDAAARLAFETKYGKQPRSNINYAKFKTEYEAEAVLDVKKKRLERLTKALDEATLELEAALQ